MFPFQFQGPTQSSRLFQQLIAVGISRTRSMFSFCPHSPPELRSEGRGTAELRACGFCSSCRARLQRITWHSVCSRLGDRFTQFQSRNRLSSGFDSSAGAAMERETKTASCPALFPLSFLNNEQKCTSTERSPLQALWHRVTPWILSVSQQ